MDTIKIMDLWHCPQCGNGTSTFRHPYAKVWCPICGHVLREEGDQTIRHDTSIGEDNNHET